MLKKLVIFLVAFSFIYAIRASAFWGSSSYSLDKGIKRIATQISNEKALFNKRVAVLNFQSTYGVDSLMSTFLAVKLLSALSGIPNRKFYLVDRMDIVKLMDEEDVFGGNGFDVDTWSRKLKADFLVIGEYTYLRKKSILDVNCKVVNPKNGSIIIAVNVKIDLTDDLLRILNTPPTKKGIISRLEQITSPNPKRGRVSIFIIKNHKKIPLNGDAPIVKVGDEIGFSIIPPVDSKLYVFNYNPASGEVIFLYPLSRLKPIIFLKNKVYFFPESVDKQAITYKVAPPLGRMSFKVIGVNSQVNLNLVRGLKSVEGCYTMDEKGLKKFLKQLSIVPPSSWWEQSLDYWIIQR